jgi:two-component system nitrate/nitrite response regulator NarL
MSLQSINEGYYSLGAQDKPPVPTFLLWENSLARTGFEQILSDTCFRVQDNAINDGLILSRFRDAKAILFIVGPTRSSGEMAHLIRGLKVHCAAARIVILANGFDLDLIMLAHEARAAGLLQTTTAPDALIKSLELIVLGESVFPGAAVLSVIENARNDPAPPHVYGATRATKDAPLSKAGGLSKREREILRLLTEGDANKMIARKLNVSEATVKVHIKAILRKIGAQNRTQAAMWAITHP